MKTVSNFAKVGGVGERLAVHTYSWTPEPALWALSVSARLWDLHDMEPDDGQRKRVI